MDQILCGLPAQAKNRRRAMTAVVVPLASFWAGSGQGIFFFLTAINWGLPGPGFGVSPPGGAAGWRGPCPTGRLKKKVSREDGRGGHEQDREVARPVTGRRHGEWLGGGLKIDRVGRTFFLPAPDIL